MPGGRDAEQHVGKEPGVCVLALRGPFSQHLNMFTNQLSEPCPAALLRKPRDLGMID